MLHGVTDQSHASNLANRRRDMYIKHLLTGMVKAATAAGLDADSAMQGAADGCRRESNAHSMHHHNEGCRSSCA